MFSTPDKMLEAYWYHYGDRLTQKYENPSAFQADIKTRDPEVAESMADFLYNDRYANQISRDEFDQRSGLPQWRDAQPTWVDTIGQNAKARVADLGAGLVDTIDHAANWLESKVPLGAIAIDQWPPRHVSSEEAGGDILFNEETSAAMRKAADEMELPDRVTWDEFKQSPVTQFIPFALEHGLVSLPDMIAAVYSVPVYVAARTGDIGHERSQNDLREKATTEDLVRAFPAAVISSMLEKIGASRVFGLNSELAEVTAKEIGKEVGKRAGKESATEALQEPVEQIGAAADTERWRRMSGKEIAGELLEASAQGAVVGAGFGGAASIPALSVQAARHRQRARGGGGPDAGTMPPPPSGGPAGGPEPDAGPQPDTGPIMPPDVQKATDDASDAVRKGAEEDLAAQGQGQTVPTEEEIEAAERQLDEDPAPADDLTEEVRRINETNPMADGSDRIKILEADDQGGVRDMTPRMPPDEERSVESIQLEEEAKLGKRTILTTDQLQVGDAVVVDDGIEPAPGRVSEVSGGLVRIVDNDGNDVAVLRPDRPTDADPVIYSASEQQEERDVEYEATVDEMGRLIKRTTDDPEDEVSIEGLRNLRDSDQFSKLPPESRDMVDDHLRDLDRQATEREKAAEEEAETKKQQDEANKQFSKDVMDAGKDIDPKAADDIIRGELNKLGITNLNDVPLENRPEFLSNIQKAMGESLTGPQPTPEDNKKFWEQITAATTGVSPERYSEIINTWLGMGDWKSLADVPLDHRELFLDAVVKEVKKDNLGAPKPTKDDNDKFLFDLGEWFKNVDDKTAAAILDRHLDLGGWKKIDEVPLAQREWFVDSVRMDVEYEMTANEDAQQPTEPAPEPKEDTAPSEPEPKAPEPKTPQATEPETHVPVPQLDPVNEGIPFNEYVPQGRRKKLQRPISGWKAGEVLVGRDSEGNLWFTDHTSAFKGEIPKGHKRKADQEDLKDGAVDTVIPDGWEQWPTGVPMTARVTSFNGRTVILRFNNGSETGVPLNENYWRWGNLMGGSNAVWHVPPDKTKPFVVANKDGIVGAVMPMRDENETVKATQTEKDILSGFYKKKQGLGRGEPAPEPEAAPEPEQATEPEPETQEEAEPKQEASDDGWLSDDQFEEDKAWVQDKLKELMGGTTLGAGLTGGELELLLRGGRMLAHHIKKGITKFPELAAKIYAQFESIHKGLGDVALRYMRRWYENARVELKDKKTEEAKALLAQMSTVEEVDAEVDRWETDGPPTVQEETEQEPEGAAPEPEPQDAPQDSDKAAKMVALADMIQERLETGETLDNPALFALANEAFGGTDASGAYDAQDAYNALELAVNRIAIDIARKAGIHTSHASVDTAIEAVKEIEALTARLPTQARRTEKKIEFQQFSTPPAYAMAVNWIAGVKNGDVALEPSAGNGGLAIFTSLLAGGKKQLTVNEIDPERADILRELGFQKVHTEDGEQIGNIMEPESFDIIVMNPPFSAAGQRSTERTKVKNNNVTGGTHILQAMSLLKPGGRLVAIMGQGFTPDAPTVRGIFQSMSRHGQVRAVVRMDGSKVYQKYGTTFDNQVVIFDKTGPGSLDGILTNSFETIEDFVRGLSSFRGLRAATEPAAAPAPTQPTPAPTSRPPAPRPPTQPTQPTARPPGGGRGGRGGSRPPAAPRPDAPRPTGPAVQDPQQQPRGQAATQDRNVLTSPSDAEESFTKFHPAAAVKALPGVKEHPANIEESAAQGSVVAPPLSYDLALAPEIIKEGRLSDVQLEAVMRAWTSFGKRFADGTRHGFFVADGTGVGKGRTSTGIIAEYFARGGKRAVWVSKDANLIDDAKRDVKGVGLDAEIINATTGDSLKGLKKTGDGIVFTTYSMLREPESARDRNRRREREEAEGIEEGAEDGAARFPHVERVINWLGEDSDAVLIFDESHEMSNLAADTQQALAGRRLATHFPSARVVYVSATGIRSAHTTMYMSRLGLWGQGTAFSDASDFAEKLAAGGKAVMELVGRELKIQGKSLSRTISFKNTEYEKLSHVMTPEQRDIYNLAAQAWQVTLMAMKQAADLQMPGADAKELKRLLELAIFFGAEQRFFETLITTLKMPTVIDQIEKALEEGYAPVVQLITTGEAAQKAALDNIQDGQTLDDINLTPMPILIRFVENNFDTAQYEQRPDPETGELQWVEVRDSEGNVVHNVEALRIKRELLEDLATVNLPENPLDLIINHFGTERVAEVTGRSQRIIRMDTQQADGTYSKMERRTRKLRAQEAQAFQDGEKEILVFSQAGGTGASYHADVNAKNQKRRMHIVLQSGWQATGAVQGFGRTLRSNSVSDPIFMLAGIDTPADARFIAPIISRLADLGAANRGQADASGGSDLYDSEDDIDNDYMQSAIVALVKQIQRGDGPITLEELNNKMGFELVEGQDVKSTTFKTSRFLNRMLALTLEDQDKVFEPLVAMMDASIEAAKDAGTYETGVEVLPHEGAEIDEEQQIYVDEDSGATTNYVRIIAQEKNRPNTWKFARESVGSRGELARNRISGKLYWFGDSPPKTIDGGRRVVPMLRRWGTNISQRIEEAEYTSEKYENITDMEEGKRLWDAEVEQVPDTTPRVVHMLEGVLLPVYDRIVEGNSAKKVNRIILDNGEQRLGRVLSPGDMTATLENFGIGADLHQYSSKALIEAIRDHRGVATLTNDAQLRLITLSGSPRIELTGASTNDMRRGGPLQEMGFLREVMAGNMRVYLPNDPNTDMPGGSDAEAILDRYMDGKQVRTLLDRRGNDISEQVRHHIEGRTPKDLAKELHDVMREDLNEIVQRLVPGARLQIDEMGDGRVTGDFTMVNGEAIIRVAMYGRARSVLRHEAIHALRELNLFTDQEWTALEKAAKRGQWVRKHKIAKRYPGMMDENGNPTDSATEEAIADEFAAWAEGKKGKRPAFMVRVFKRIMQFFRDMTSWLRKHDVTPEAGNIFEKVESGEVGRRKRRATRSEPAIRKLKVDLTHRSHRRFSAKDITPGSDGLIHLAENDDLDNDFGPQLYRYISEVDTDHMPIVEDPLDWGDAENFMHLLEDAGLFTPEDMAKIKKVLKKSNDAKAIKAIKKILIADGVRGLRYTNTYEGGSGFSIAVIDPSILKVDPSYKQHVEFADPDTEARWQEAAKGVQPSAVSRVSDAVAEEWRRLTNAREHLPATARFSDAREKLVHLEQAEHAAKERIAAMFERVMGKLPPEDIDLLTRKMVLDDLLWTSEEGMDIPFGLKNTDDVLANLQEVEAVLQSKPELESRLAIRTAAKNDLKDQMVRSGVLTHKQSRNPQYFRHQVLEYAALRGRAGSGRSRKVRSTYWHSRRGSEKDINANYFQAESDWMYKAHQDVATAKFLNWLRKSKYNAKAGFVIRAKGENMANLTAKMKGDELLAADWQRVRRNVAIAMQTLRKTLIYRERRGELDNVVPPHMHKALRAFIYGAGDKGVGDDGGNSNFFKLVTYLADSDIESVNDKAGIVLATIFNRRKFLKDTLGDAYVNPQNMGELVKRYAPETHSTWQPNSYDGKTRAIHIFTGKTPTEHVLDKAMDNLRGIVGKTLTNDQVSQLEDMLQNQRNVRFIGGPMEEMILPNELVDTLNEFYDRQVTGAVDLLAVIVTSKWKQWTLFNPARFAKYYINNMTGDTDALLATRAGKGVAAHLPQAFRDVKAMIYRNRISDNLNEALEKGVVQSSLVMQEVSSTGSHLADDVFRPARITGPLKVMGAYFKQVMNFARLRENAFRYAAYLHYKKEFAAGKSLEEIGFGASPPWMVKGISDRNDAAARMARDLLGDYGSIPYRAKWARKRLIPFVSWLASNTTRYLNLFRNAYLTGRDVSASQGVAMGAYAGGGLMLRMFILYAAVTMWNNLLFGDDEELKGTEERLRLHANLGRWGNDTVTLRFQGALSDFLAWFGLEDAGATFMEVQRGRASVGDVAGAIAKAPVNRLIQGVTPLYKLPVELGLGKVFFPDVFNPRTMRDRSRHAARTFSLDYPVAQAKRALGESAPVRDPLKTLASAVVYMKDPGRMAYDQIRGKAFEFIKHETGQNLGGQYGARSQALYNLRQARKLGDESSERSAFSTLREFRATPGSIRQSIRRASPLGMFPNQRLRAAFLRSLSTRERDTLRRGTKWYNTTMR